MKIRLTLVVNVNRIFYAEIKNHKKDFVDTSKCLTYNSKRCFLCQYYI